MEYEIVATGGDGVLRLWRLEPSKQLVDRQFLTQLRSDDSGREKESRSGVDRELLGEMVVRGANDQEGFTFPRSSHQNKWTPKSCLAQIVSTDLFNDLEGLLREFVAFQSISGRPAYLEECWRAARFLSSCLESIGAVVKLINVGSEYSPLVVGRLGSDLQKPTVLLYSHYDVVPATAAWTSHGADAQVKNEMVRNTEDLEDIIDQTNLTCPSATSSRSSPRKGPSRVNNTPSPSSYSTLSTPTTFHWQSDPWQLTAMNGYFYGRGVTDNKGPILAQLFAVLGLKRSGAAQKADLPVNVVWLSEGEEESGSAGFEEAIGRLQETSDLLAGASSIVCTNSYWVDDNKPCIV